MNNTKCTIPFSEDMKKHIKDISVWLGEKMERERKESIELLLKTIIDNEPIKITVRWKSVKLLFASQERHSTVFQGGPEIYKICKLIGMVDSESDIAYNCILYEKSIVDNCCRYLLGLEYDKDALIQHRLAL